MELAVKVHVDAICNHPKVFFLNLNLFSIHGDAVFSDSQRTTSVLPKYVAIGSDTKCQQYVRNAIHEIQIACEHRYKLPSGQHAIISANPIILGGDRLVIPAFTGGPSPQNPAAAIFDVM